MTSNDLIGTSGIIFSPEKTFRPIPQRTLVACDMRARPTVIGNEDDFT